jgi:hypothetical protein
VHVLPNSLPGFSPHSLSARKPSAPPKATNGNDVCKEATGGVRCAARWGSCVATRSAMADTQAQYVTKRLGGPRVHLCVRRLPLPIPIFCPCAVTVCQKALQSVSKRYGHAGARMISFSPWAPLGEPVVLRSFAWMMHLIDAVRRVTGWQARRPQKHDHALMAIAGAEVRDFTHCSTVGLTIRTLSHLHSIQVGNRPTTTWSCYEVSPQTQPALRRL